MNYLMKYPRTPHLPWSTPDKTDVSVASIFAPDTHVVVTEKLDGENTSIYGPGRTHARSIDSRDHASRHYVKRISAQLHWSLLPERAVLLGENVYAKHSIHYTRLTSWFYLFGIRLDGLMLSWSDVQSYAYDLGIPTVPVLWEGPWELFKHAALIPRASSFGEECEGYVVRNSSSFPVGDFQYNVAKYVRPNHVQSDSHWMHQALVLNELAT